MKKILFFSLSVLTLLFSCGPRSGIHREDESSETNEKNYGYCGNAGMDEANTRWVSSVYGISGDGARGRKLFKQNCAVCHALTNQKLTGSGLKGIMERVPEPKITWLKNFILNSDKVYKSRDKYAKKLRKQAQGADMTHFEGELSDKDLDDLLIYVIGNTR